MNDDHKPPKIASWRRHLYLLTTAALLPAFAGIYYLCFWLRFEGQLSDCGLACFRATVALGADGETRLVRGLAHLPGVESFGHLLRPGDPAPGGHAAAC